MKEELKRELIKAAGYGDKFKNKLEKFAIYSSIDEYIEMLLVNGIGRNECDEIKIELEKAGVYDNVDTVKWEDGNTYAIEYYGGY